MNTQMILIFNALRTMQFRVIPQNYTNTCISRRLYIVDRPKHLYAVYITCDAAGTVPRKYAMDAMEQLDLS